MNPRPIFLGLGVLALLFGCVYLGFQIVLFVKGVIG